MPSRSRSAIRSSTSAGAFALGGLVGAAAGIALGRWRQHLAVGRQAQASAEREAERAWLSAQLVTAEQDERRRLALALHDGPLQSLSGIALMQDAALSALKEGRADEAATLLEGSLGRQRETVQTIRDLSFAIEPVILRDRGFTMAVRELADQIERVQPISITLATDAGDELGETAQIALYQTVRESLAQAVRRQPRTIVVALERRSDGGAVTSVVDDGMDERRKSSLDAIEERARPAGGRVERRAGVSGGTVVTIVLPPHAAAV
jgi:two-component system sensor histidine kinase UhpB